MSELIEETKADAVAGLVEQEYASILSELDVAASSTCTLLDTIDDARTSITDNGEYKNVSNLRSLTRTIHESADSVAGAAEAIRRHLYMIERVKEAQEAGDE